MKPFNKWTLGSVFVHLAVWLVCAALWFLGRVAVGFLWGSPSGDWNYAAKSGLWFAATVVLLVFAMGQTYEARSNKQGRKK